MDQALNHSTTNEGHSFDNETDDSLAKYPAVIAGLGLNEAANLV